MTRRCLALAALGTLCLFAPARSPANEKTTGAPVEQTWSWDVALTRASEPGPPFMLEGTVVGLPDSLPIHGATIYFYHADTRGRYSPGGESKPTRCLLGPRFQGHRFSSKKMLGNIPDLQSNTGT